jgi:hypothetical protein
VNLRTTITLLLALAAGLAAGCGSEEEKGSPIPEQAVVDLDSRLDEVERRMAAAGGACGDITNDSAPAANAIIESLPQDVDPDVRQALQAGYDRLFTLAGEQCDETKGQETEPDPEPLPEPETETETVPTEPETETETIPTLPEEPPIEPVPPEEDPSGGVGSGGAATPEDEG